MLYDNNVAPEEDTSPLNSFEIAHAVADYSVVDNVLANETAAALRNEVDTIEESVQHEETEAPDTTDVDRSEYTQAEAIVPWPEGVSEIDQCIYADDIKGGARVFPDIGKMDTCSCVRDCYRDACTNATLNIFCSKTKCQLKGNCPNTAYTFGGVELMRCAYGYGVRATEFIPAGAVIGEYTEELTMHDFEKDEEVAEYALELLFV